MRTKKPIGAIDSARHNPVRRTEKRGKTLGQLYTKSGGGAGEERPYGGVVRPNGGALRRLVSQHDGELRLAGLSWIIEGGTFRAAFRSAKEKPLLGIFGQANDASLALGIGSDLKIEFVEVHKTVRDVHADGSGVHRRSRVVRDRKVGAAGAKAGVHFRDGFCIDRRIGRRRRTGLQCSRGNQRQGEDAAKK